jgi:hypothetical protein
MKYLLLAFLILTITTSCKYKPTIITKKEITKSDTLRFVQNNMKYTLIITKK